jgi:hypothetical protein
MSRMKGFSPVSRRFFSSSGVISSFVVFASISPCPFLSSIKYNLNLKFALGGATVARSLEDALKEVLEDDNKVSKYEAKVIRELVMSDGVVSEEEKAALQKALANNTFDEEAFELLSGLLLRSHMKD